MEPQRFIPTTDKAFKKVLANEQHKEIIQGFLQDFFNYHAQIEEIRILTPYNIDGYPQTGPAENDESYDLRETVHDVRIEIATADVIIEMQLLTEADFAKRVWFYQSVSYTRNYAKNADAKYRSLKPIWSMNFIRFNRNSANTTTVDLQANADLRENAENSTRLGDGEIAEPLLEYTLKDQYDRPLLPELVRVAFFDLRYPASNPRLEAWRRFFTQGIVATEAPDYLREAGKIMDWHNLTPKERYDFAYEQKRQDVAEAILADAIDIGKAEGKTIGIAEGIAEGKADEARRIARSLLIAGVDVNLIAASTGIPPAEIGNL